MKTKPFMFTSLLIVEVWEGAFPSPSWTIAIPEKRWNDKTWLTQMAQAFILTQSWGDMKATLEWNEITQRFDIVLVGGTTPEPERYHWGYLTTKRNTIISAQ